MQRKFINVMRLIFASIFLQVGSVSSAEIGQMEQHDYLYIKGEIKSGDFEKFLDAILAKGAGVSKVLLSSPGGDVVDAMLIGAIIRDLGLETEVSLSTPIGNIFSLKNEENQGCISACFLIYVSGIHKYGNLLGVHRFYVNPERNKNVSLKYSSELASAYELKIDSYMQAMGVPQVLIDKIKTVSSEEMYYLPPSYVEEYFYGYIPAYQEWMTAKCGSEILANKIVDAGNAKEGMDKLMQIWACQRHELDKQIFENFAYVIIKALPLVRDKYISNDSRLKFLKGRDNYDLTNVVGMNNFEAARFLTITGIGEAVENELKKSKNISHTISNGLRVGFDKNGRVYMIVVSDFDTRGSAPINKFFIEGLSFSSTMVDFYKFFGIENVDMSFRAPSGNYFWYFKYKDISVDILVGENNEVLEYKANNLDDYK